MTIAERELAAARNGDEDAFARLIEPYRATLHAHCYRMLGSYQDAEDALQETLLSAWRALPRFQERSSLKSWLYKIATNASLKAIERRPKRVLPIDYGPPADPHDGLSAPLVESTWVEPYPEATGDGDITSAPEAHYEHRESLELAFVAALQHIPARQRAVLILRDVLGFSAREVGEALDISSVAVDSALQRAHRTVDERLPERSQQATLAALGDEQLRDVVGSFVDAWERTDVDAVVELLTNDATFAMPPHSTWLRGEEAIAMFMRARPLAPGRRWRLVDVGANGQPAFGAYRFDARREQFVADAIMVLALTDARISDIACFRSPAMFAQFGLPATIQP
jgi:RNA polymerase sigma-70 factor (ECF subfamily)